MQCALLLARARVIPHSLQAAPQGVMNLRDGGMHVCGLVGIVLSGGTIGDEEDGRMDHGDRSGGPMGMAGRTFLLGLSSVSSDHSNCSA